MTIYAAGNNTGKIIKQTKTEKDKNIHKVTQGLKSLQVSEHHLTALIYMFSLQRITLFYHHILKVIYLEKD